MTLDGNFSTMKDALRFLYQAAGELVSQPDRIFLSNLSFPTLRRIREAASEIWFAVKHTPLCAA